jgi:hypothetical protein
LYKTKMKKEVDFIQVTAIGRGREPQYGISILAG